VAAGALVALTMLVVPPPARGDASPPQRSGTGVARLALVTAHAPRTVPNVDSTGQPACSPVRRDTTRTTGPTQPVGNTFDCGFFVDLD
jgi:hypothetical protein